MHAATPVPAPAAVSTLPLRIAAFCVLWSSAFAVAKLALADCPPLFMFCIYTIERINALSK